MIKRVGMSLLAGLAMLSAVHVAAGVTGVVTHSSATLQFRPGVTDTGIQAFDGLQLADSQGNNAFGSGGTFASTSRVDPDAIEFRNGNAAAGRFTFLTSRTLVDISFTNDGDTSVVPTLHSTIAPAGLGLFTAGQALHDLLSLRPGSTFPGDFRDFQAFRPAGDTGEIAGAAFLFRISGGGKEVYRLEGSVGLVANPKPVLGAPVNILVEDLAAARNELRGFRMISEPDSQREFSFVWDATDLLVDFPPDTLLAPGESSTLTYETVVTSFSRAQCFEVLTNACIVAYASFGDPVGRGGSVSPMRSAFSSAAAQALAGEPSDLSFAAFKFQLPEFREGTLSYGLIGRVATPVAEPAMWAMLVVGFAGLLRVPHRQAYRV